MHLTQIQKTKTIQFKFWKALFLSSQRYHPPEFFVCFHNKYHYKRHQPLTNKTIKHGFL